MKRALALVFGLSLFGLAFGLPVEFFTAKVGVQDQSNAALQKALPEAFAMVLAQVSGNPQIANTLMAAKYKPDYASFLQNYTFVRENNAQGQSELMVQITFDRNAVENFLQKEGQVAQHENTQLQWVQLQIDGINNFQDYSAALHALKNLQTIRKMNVNDTNGSVLKISIEIEGGAQGLTQALAQNQNFVADGENNSELNYHWKNQ